MKKIYLTFIFAFLGILSLRAESLTQLEGSFKPGPAIILIATLVTFVLVGVFFGFALQRALEPEGVTELAIPVAQLIFYVVFAGLAGVLAAIWPARRAARLNVLDSISYE